MPTPVVRKTLHKAADSPDGMPGPRRGTIHRATEIPAVGRHRSDGRFAPIDKVVEILKREAAGQHRSHSHNGDGVGIWVFRARHRWL